MKERKIFPLTKLKNIIEEEKKRGKKIVLANGCFDLIHVGHIRYLRTAKEKGDILVVALNSDTSVHKLKGDGRPIFNLKERLEILAAVEYINYLTYFEEKSVDRILLTLKPDIHAKGSDYTEESVPERKTVLAYGGKTAITGGPKIRSTSEIIREIKKTGRKTEI